jgi:hypothetical protein
MFHVGKTSNESIVLVAANLKNLLILFWEKDSFVQRLSLRTTKSVTCILTTLASVIYATDRIIELDLKSLSFEGWC